MRISPVRLGAIVAVLLALVHALWAGLVATGFAQPLLDFIFWAHFLNQPYQVQPFDMARAAILVGVTAAIGLVMGYVLGLIWNALAPAVKR